MYSFSNTCQLPPGIWLISFEHQITSCLSSALHCFIWSYCSLFAARLSRYTSAYSLVVQYCSNSSRHHYQKMKMILNIWIMLHLFYYVLPWCGLISSSPDINIWLRKLRNIWYLNYTNKCGLAVYVASTGFWYDLAAKDAHWSRGHTKIRCWNSHGLVHFY